MVPIWVSVSLAVVAVLAAIGFIAFLIDRLNHS
jgi:hypothetical protein